MFSLFAPFSELRYDFLLYLIHIFDDSPPWIQSLVRSSSTAVRLLDYHYACCVDRVRRIFDPGNETSNYLRIPQSRTCCVCRKIDFPALLEDDSDRRWPWRPWQYTDMGTIQEMLGREADCELCHWILERLGEMRKLDTVLTCSIRITGYRFEYPTIGGYELEDWEASAPRLHLRAVLFKPNEWADIAYFRTCPYSLESVRRTDTGMRSTHDRFTGRLLRDERNAHSLYKDWLNICCSEHRGRCANGAIEPHNTPINLIEVETGRVVPLDTSARYVALSYVWGQHGHLKLTRNNSTRFMSSGIDGPIPRTIQEAMSLVCDMGEQYLWVDALCIVQNDQEHKDAQILQMGTIYSRAVCTIVAAAGQSAHSGLWPNRRDSIKRQRCFRIGRTNFMSMINPFPFGQDLRLSPARELVDAESNPNAWTRRAWTLQEIMLSRRALVFASDQAYWYCNNAVWLEEAVLERNPLPWSIKAFTTQTPDDITGKLRQHSQSFMRFFRGATFAVPSLRVLRKPTWLILKRGGTSFEPLQAYAVLALDYNQRSMSDNKDNFAAFRGILEALCDHYPSVGPGVPGIGFVYALPVQDFAWGLGWTCSGLEDMHRKTRRASGILDRSDATRSASSVDLVPSWSWAAWYSECPTMKGIGFHGFDQYGSVQVSEPVIHFYIILASTTSAAKKTGVQEIQPKERYCAPADNPYPPPPDPYFKNSMAPQFSPSDWLCSPAKINCDDPTLPQQLPPGTLTFYTSTAMLPVLRYTADNRVACKIIGPGYMQRHSMTYGPGSNDLIGTAGMGSLEHIGKFEHENMGYVSKEYRARLMDQEDFWFREELETGDILMFEFCVIHRHLYNGQNLSLLAVEWSEGVAYRVGSAVVSEDNWVHVVNRRWRQIVLR